MGRVTHYPSPDTQTAYDHFATKLGVETDPSDVHADMKAGVDDFVVVDTRDEAAFIRAHVPGAIHLPYAAMDKETAAHFLPDRDRVVVCYCWGTYCNAADKGAVQLAALGYKVKVMIGGIDAWRYEELPIEGAEADQD